MCVDRSNVIDADRDTVWKIVSDTDRYPSFMTRLERWESANVQGNSVSVPDTSCTGKWLGAGGRPDGSRRVRRSARHGLGRYHRHDAARSNPVARRGRWPGMKVTFRLSYQAPGGIWGYIADRVAVG